MLDDRGKSVDGTQSSVRNSFGSKTGVWANGGLLLLLLLCSCWLEKGGNKSVVSIFLFSGTRLTSLLLHLGKE